MTDAVVPGLMPVISAAALSALSRARRTAAARKPKPRRGRPLPSDPFVLISSISATADWILARSLFSLASGIAEGLPRESCCLNTAASVCRDSSKTDVSSLVSGLFNKIHMSRWKKSSSLL